MTGNRDNILIYRKGSIGDTVVSLPCFHRVAASFPDAKRYVLTNFPVSENAAPLELVLGGSGLIHGVISHEPGLRRPDRIWRLAVELRRLKIHTVVYVTEVHSQLRAAREAAFLRLCGIGRIIGVPLRKSQLSYRSRPDSHLLEHEAERLARWLSPLGPIDLHRRDAWDLHLQQKEIDAANAVLLPMLSDAFVVINVGGKAKDKDWGDENWSQLLRQASILLPRAGLVFVGSRSDAERSETLGRNWLNHRKVINACGVLTPRESSALIDRAMMFVGHDSGPMHLAAAQAVRCVALFGNGNRPGVWHPFGDGHEVLHDMRGVQHILVDDVLSAISRIAATLHLRPRSSVGR